MEPFFKRLPISELKIKHYREKLLLSLLILIVVSLGIYENVFVSMGLFDFNSGHPEPIQLDHLQLENIGIQTSAVEENINRLVASMNNAQQGTHFLFGMLAGLLFSQATAGLSVGILKEGVDFFTNYRAGHINRGYFIDATVDSTFWLLGGIVGFYLLSAVYDMCHLYGIHGPKDLIVFLGKNAFRLRKPKPAAEQQ